MVTNVLMVDIFWWLTTGSRFWQKRTSILIIGWVFTFTKSSLPIGLAELWESEPIGTCKNNNPIHDQGCGYNYLDDRPSKWGFPLTLTKTTWIFNFYCTAVFLKAIQLPWTRWFQKCITLLLAVAVNLTEFYFSHFQTSYNQVLYHFGIVRPNEDEWLLKKRQYNRS